MKKKPNKTNKSSNSDSKLKPLSPTLRQKKRFIKAKIVSENKFEFKILSENIIDQLLVFMGSIEFGKSGIWLLRDKFNYEKQEIVLKVSTKNKDKLIAILSLINKINNQNAKIEIIKVSGTLKGLEK